MVSWDGKARLRGFLLLFKMHYSRYVHAKSFQLCPTVCDPMDCSPPGSSVHGILQQEYWSELSCPPSGDLLDPGIEPTSPVDPACGRILYR